MNTNPMHKRLETTLFSQILSFYFMIFMSDLQKRRPGLGAISATVAACPFAGGDLFKWLWLKSSKNSRYLFPQHLSLLPRLSSQAVFSNSILC